jgi:glycosyltransferase involved in cell wall biosynthesis
MKILQLYNLHRHGGGADVVARRTVTLLREAGHEVETLVRDSAALRGVGGAIQAFGKGLYAADSVRELDQLLEQVQPDVVHAHELYPLITPWVFRRCQTRGVPVVMTCHDYRLSCPIATHLRQGRSCYACADGTPWHCLQHHCADGVGKSAAYAARTWVARKAKLFDAVDLFLTPSAAAAQVLVQHAGLTTERIRVVGNPVAMDVDDSAVTTGGDYIGYAGRMEPEKGFTVLTAALKHTGLALRVAGSSSGPYAMQGVTFLGNLDRQGMRDFYRQARFVVVPSLCHETFGLVVVEALACGTPVIVSDMGALPEVSGPGGIVVPAGDVTALRAALLDLWNNGDRCMALAQAGRYHVQQYNESAYVAALESAYAEIA